VKVHRDAQASRPAGRDQVVASLLLATERLCSTRQPSSVTVREIASEAGVTTSLLYFYFASKDGIIVATLRSVASELDAAAAGAGSAQEMAAEVSRLLIERPAFSRIIAWLILEGRSITEEMGDHPFMRRLMTAFVETDPEDPHTRAGAVVTMLLANALFHRGVNVALGRSSDDERLIQALDHVVVALSSDGAVRGNIDHGLS
jgi:AcrR family transcriptional regulator